MKIEKKKQQALRLSEQIEFLEKEIARVEKLNGTFQKRFDDMCRTDSRNTVVIDDLSQRIEINKIMLRQMNRALERMKKKHNSLCHQNGTDNGERVC